VRKRVIIAKRASLFPLPPDWKVGSGKWEVGSVGRGNAFMSDGATCGLWTDWKVGVGCRGLKVSQIILNTKTA